MKLPDEDIAVSDLAQKYKPYFDLGDRVFDDTRNIVDGKVKNINSLHMCLLPVLARMLRLHYSAYRLASVGRAEEAKLPVRAMFENLVNVLALEHNDNSLRYAQRWIGWDLSNHMKQVDKYLQTHPDRTPDFDKLKAIHKDTKDAVAAESRARGEEKWPGNNARITKYVEDRWDQFMGHGPSMENMRRLAAIVDGAMGGGGNLQRIYDQFYGYASGVVHGSDLQSLLDINEISQNRLVLRLAPSETDMEEIMITSSFMLGRTGLSISRVLNIGGQAYHDKMKINLDDALALAKQSAVWVRK